MKRLFSRGGAAGLFSAAWLAFGAQGVVHAQEQPGEEDASDPGAARDIEEVVVTGSSIKRQDLEGALPVQVITAEQIAASGTTAIGDYIARLPSMQGFTVPDESVGGGGGGFQTASLHGIGEEYTLVLLNGRRLPPGTSGSAVDISAIPSAMVERIEVLTDGASSIYGSDAIAGVVNFILKDHDVPQASIRYDAPVDGGGETLVAELSAGYKNLSGSFRSVFGYTYRKQEQLAAADREFAKTGIIEATIPGISSNTDRFLFFNGSGNAIPGNALIRYFVDPTLPAQIPGGDPESNRELGELRHPDNLVTRVFNPYRETNGQCAPSTSPIVGSAGTECFFDYTSTLFILPERELNSVYGRAEYDLTDSLTVHGSVLFSNSVIVARIAPYPTGHVTLYSRNDDTAPADVPLVNQYVIPHTTAEEIANVDVIRGRWRALPSSNRTTQYDTDTLSFVVGAEGSFGDINYYGALNHSMTTRDQAYLDGWLSATFRDAVGAGEIDIFSAASTLDSGSAAAARANVYRGEWDTTEVSQTIIDAGGSMPVFDLPGGPMIVGVGVDYRTGRYEEILSEANKNRAVLFLSTGTPFILEREQFGVFVEGVFPVIENVELAASLRFDQIGAISDELSDPLEDEETGDINESVSDVTYKISGRWNVIEGLGLRASIGTGFKMATMRQIGEPRIQFGVTGGTYTCPFTTANDPENKRALCLPGEFQAQVFREGASDLKPETSLQFSVGAAYSNDFVDVTVDYWNVEQEDLVERLTQSQIFENPETYYHLFTGDLNLATGEEELAIIQVATNAGEAKNSGIDYAVTFHFETPLGPLDLGVRGTHMLKSWSSLTGSSLGRFGDDTAVVFDDIISVVADFVHGDFAHSLQLNWRSGYDDQEVDLTEILSDGTYGADVKYMGEIPSYATLDYQFQYDLSKFGVNITAGVNNLLNEEPPRSFTTDGPGHQLGYDGRYTDSYGTTVYVKVGYSMQ